MRQEEELTDLWRVYNWGRSGSAMLLWHVFEIMMQW